MICPFTSFDVKHCIHVFVGFILQTSESGIMFQMGILHFGGLNSKMKLQTVVGKSNVVDARQYRVRICVQVSCISNISILQLQNNREKRKKGLWDRLQDM